MWHRVQLSLAFLCYVGVLINSVASAQQGDQTVMLLAAKNIGDAEKNKINKVNKLIASGDLSIAKELIRRHLMKYKNDPDYLILLARIQQYEGNTSAAITALQQARNSAKEYEDIYLLEAGLLKTQGTETSCYQLIQLKTDYERYTNKKQLDRFNGLISETRRGRNQIELGMSHDELSNNRGTWKSAFISNRYVMCSGSSIRAGYQQVTRYERRDAEVFIGGGLRMDRINYDLEYRESKETDILAQNTWSGQVSYQTGLSADLFLLGTRKKYDGIITSSTGFGIDYYISNYQVMLITEQTNYSRNRERLDSSQAQRYYLGYYFDDKKYIRFGYVRGKELDNDGSINPPYGKVKTVLLSSFIPVTARSGILMELKRHHQSGYYEQNGIRFAIRFTY